MFFISVFKEVMQRGSVGRGEVDRPVVGPVNAPAPVSRLIVQVGDENAT